MTTAMRKIAILSGTLLLLTGCFHENHELGSLVSGEGLLGTSLGWEMPDDAGTAVHALSISVGSATPFTKAYKDAKEASGELITVPSGKSQVLATINMTDADGFSVSGMPPVKATSEIGDVIVSLKDPVSSPAQAWFGVTQAEIREKDITMAAPVLQRLLSILSVNIANVPAGTKLAITLSNVARSVNLTAKDASGRWGVPSTESVGDLGIASLTASSDGPLGVEGFTVLPTASAYERCILTVDVTAANGNQTQYVCDAPHTESGKGYTLQLDFNTIQPYMYLDSYSISAWEDGWTVSGEVLNPQE